MRDWTQLMGSDTQQSLYKFVLEGQVFAVYELYWSVMSLGGYNAVGKWKDVGNDMMLRKLQCLVSKTPGKNYGLIRNQWDRWNLSKYQELHSAKPLPESYLSPALVPSKTQSESAPQNAGGSGSSRSNAPHPAFAQPEPNGSHVALSGPHPAFLAKKESTPGWRGRQMWPLREEEKTAKVAPVTYPWPANYTSSSPVQLVDYPEAAMASLEQSLPPIPVHQPLPALPDLNYDEKLELRLQKSFSYVRGLRKEDIVASRDHSRAWRSRVEGVRFRSEALGLDRYHRRYWILSDDLSRIWVEKTDYTQRDGVKWGCYSTMKQVDDLVAALNPHGIRENALREAIEVYRNDIEQAMSKSQQEPASGVADAAARNTSDEGHKEGSNLSNLGDKSEAGETADASVCTRKSKHLADMRASHLDISTHAAKVLAERWTEEGKTLPHACCFSQALFGYDDEPALNEGRQVLRM